MGILDLVPPGVITGDDVLRVMQYAEDNNFAIPSINVTSTSTVNAVLEAARDIKSPIMVQFSHGGSQFTAGKGLDNANQHAAVLGAVSGAHYVRSVAKAYGIPVILHTDHCAKELLPWMDGMLKADEEYFKAHGEPLFSSHMLDLSKESKEENIRICVDYLKRMAPMKQWLEMEIGITGGEEDGVNNEDVDNNSLFSQPEDILDIVQAFSPVSKYFSIAAAFGNVHGSYAPGNVKLHPELLAKHQTYVKEKLSSKKNHPVFFVFHGGSGSTKEEIREAVQNGVVKMNVDTDTQWAYWEGVKNFYEKNRDYLQGQVGNPKGPDAPNKKFYDPRVWIREGEKTMIKRVQEACSDLGNVNRL